MPVVSRRTLPLVRLVVLRDRFDKFRRTPPGATRGGCPGIRERGDGRVPRATRPRSVEGVCPSPGIPPSVVRAYLAKSGVPSDPFTPHEREVPQFVAEGRTIKEVGELLGISAKSHGTSS
jgi:hypothetical protein